MTKHYQINISPQAVAWGQMLAICGAIYGPRIAVIAMTARANSDARKRQGAMEKAAAANAMGVPKNEQAFEQQINPAQNTAGKINWNH